MTFERQILLLANELKNYHQAQVYDVQKTRPSENSVRASRRFALLVGSQMAKAHTWHLEGQVALYHSTTRISL